MSVDHMRQAVEAQRQVQREQLASLQEVVSGLRQSLLESGVDATLLREFELNAIDVALLEVPRADDGRQSQGRYRIDRGPERDGRRGTRRRPHRRRRVQPCAEDGAGRTHTQDASHDSPTTGSVPMP